MKRPDSRIGARAAFSFSAFRSRAFRSGVGALAVASLLGVASAPLRAAEPFEPFLQGLDNKGMFEPIVWYLDEQAKNPDLDAETKKSIPFHQGYYLLEWAKIIKDTKIRTEKLDQAAAKFGEFVKANPSDDRVTVAAMNLGKVLVERAKSKISEAERPANAGNKDKLLGEALAIFKEAQTAIDDAVKKMDDKLKAIPKDLDPQKDRDKIAARDALRGEFLVARDSQAKLLYEKSKAYPAGSKERVEALKAAAKAFHDNADRFSRFAIADLSRVQESQCLVEIGDPQSRQQAIALLDLVLSVEQEAPEMRAIQAQAVQLAMQILMHADEKKADKAVERADKFLAKTRGAEDREEDFLGVRWFGVLARKQLLAAATDNDAKRKLTREIVTNTQTVARSPNSHREEARKLLQDPAFGGAAAGAPTDFAGAWDETQSNFGAMIEFMTELDTVADPMARADLEKKIKTAQENALASARLALSLKNAGAEPPLVDAVVKAHYLICAVYLMQGDAARSAVMADYITQNYPDSADARPAADCAVKAYTRLFALAQGDRTFEAANLERAAKFVLQRWSDFDDVAGPARLAMLTVELDRGDYDKLQDLLKQVKDDSPTRAEMELRVGGAEWKRYLQQSRLPEESRPTKAQLDAYAAEAEKLLVAGVNRASKQIEAGKVSQVYLRGQASLAQLYSRSAKHNEALAVLEAKPNGVLTLLEASNPTATDMPGLDTTVYSVALQSYVSNGNQARAEAMMKALETAVAASGEQAQQMLVAIYVRLGRELEEDLKRLNAAQKREDYRKTLDSTMGFLKKIAEKGAQNTFATTNWVANTFYSLGRAATDTGSSGNAKELFAEASKTYGEMLKKSDDWWPDKTKADVYRNAVRIRQAECLREIGDYEKAVAELEKILESSGNNLDAQKAVAQTYQDWGVSGPDAGKLNIALAGKKKGAKNFVWGWNQMAKTMQRHALDTIPNPDDPSENLPAPFAETFFEARYNLSNGMFLAATKVDSANKKKHLAAAAQSIGFVAKQYPKMGGVVMYAQFDKLMKEIQKQQGEAKPAGLADITKAMEAPAPEATAEAAATTAGTGATPKSTGPKAAKKKEEEGGISMMYVVAMAIAVLATGVFFLMTVQKKKAPGTVAKGPDGKPIAVPPLKEVRSEAKDVKIDLS